MESEGRIARILRCFDLDPAYGPAMGLSRLERWERADELGLAPPAGVRAILMTKEGHLRYAQSVLAAHRVE